MTKWEKFMEVSMGKINDLMERYGISRAEAIELLKLRQLDNIDSTLSEIKNTLIDGVEANLNGIQRCLEQ